MFTTLKCSSALALALLGGIHCDVPKMVGIALWKPSTIFTDDFGKEELDALIQDGGFIGSVMGDSIVNNDTEATYSESIMKIRSQTDAGRKGFNVTFEKTPCFHNELNKLNNSTNWAFTPVLEDGSLFAYQSNDGTRRPFPAKLFVGMYMLPIMGVEEKGTVLGVDLMPKGLYNWQNSGVVLDNDEIDFTEVNPVAGVTITVNPLVATSVTTVLQVSNLCSDASILGLALPGSWKMERNGVLEAVTLASYADGKYTLTHAALVAGDKVRFLLSDSGQSVIAVDTNYYAGTSAIKTVA